MLKNVLRCCDYYSNIWTGLDPTKFRYASGSTYTYRYEADVASSVDSTAGGDESRLHMTAKVHLEVHSPCDWVLKVSLNNDCYSNIAYD